MSTSPDGSPQFYAIPGGADQACEHDVVNGLGNGGLNRYFECAACGCVLVRETGIGGTTGATDQLGTVDPNLEDLLEDLEAYHEGRDSPYAPARATPETLLDRFLASLRRLLP